MKLNYLFITFVLTSTLLFSQTTTQLKSLDAYFEKSLKEWQIPGMAIAIVNADSIVFSKGYGYANIAKKTKVDANTLFAVASNSKAFTASSLAQLVEEKKLKWTDNVVDYIPYFKMYNDYVTNHFTIEDLLSHHSGLVTFSGDLLWYATTKTPKEIITAQQYLKPKYEFRTTFGYSNIAFLTAGEVLTKISGESWQNYVTKHFIKPLGMNRTLTSTSQLKSTTNYATPYYYKDGKNIALDWVNWDNIAPAGGIISSANDFAKWIQLNINKGTVNGKKYFSETSFNQLTTPHTNFSVRDNDEKVHFKSYGLGWSLQDYQGYKVVSHSGGYDGMISKSFYIPEKKIGAVILTNSINWVSSALTNKILDVLLTGKTDGKDWSAMYLFYKKKQDSVANVKSKKNEDLRNKLDPKTLPLKDYTGIYKDKMYGTVTVTLKNNALYFTMDKTPIFYGVLNHWNGSIFTFNFPKHLVSLPEGKLWFDIDKNGAVSKLHIDVPNPDFDFTEFEFIKQ